MKNALSRRSFVAVSAAGATGAAAGASQKLAVLGGEPVRRKPFPSWPVITDLDRQGVQRVLESGNWYRGRGHQNNNFEKEYAELIGAKHCLLTSNGTNALYTALNALDIGPGDEVLVPPYTFIATVNVVLLQHALPVFIDTDIETFQIDATKIEPAITERTVAVIPVHLGGNPANLDTVLRVAKKHNLTVIEDACQAHLAEWRGRKVGTYGRTGCFSFQNSKNLTSGEGGAILTNDGEVAERCYAFLNNSRGRKASGYNFTYRAQGTNARMTEFQAAILHAQVTRLEEQTHRRETNAEHLTKLLKEIPGISVERQYDGTTRNAYHLYMFRYRKEAFAGAPRAKFLKALRAEGIPCSGGYRPLNKTPFVRNTVNSKFYKRIFPAKVLAEWEERNQCPVNDRLCEEAVWFTQTMLLGTRGDMDQIAEAIRKIQAQASQLRSV